MPPPAVRLALLWHMHQPYYLDPPTGESVLPWVRLHAIKDYGGMVAMLEAYPGVRVTFNLVPALVEQVEAYAAERTWDRQLVLGLRPATELDRADTEWFVREGFHAHPPTMIEPYPRYAELWRRQASGVPFDAAALTDLQVWQKLAWVDPDVARADPRIVGLRAKGRDYDDADKAALREVELALLRRVVPLYRSAADRGQVELSCSPYFHPILPLLCDSAAHHDAHPGAPLPHPAFRWPEDADDQLVRAAQAHAGWFGRPPAGVWPSEGGVSPATAAAVARAGFRWMATDEAILRASRALAGLETPAALCHRTHEIATPDGPVRVVFRDHGLSDAIGFTYQGWAAEGAVGDFVERLRAAGRQAALPGSPPTVAVILDGENAWEHYADGGRPFLRALYGALEAAADIEPVTMSEATTGEAEPLPRLFAGSWIHADFGIWIGHADDRRAWAQLARARAAFAKEAKGLDAAAVEGARQALRAAEGSDWFWWYGDDHSSLHDRDFDALFRRHVRRAWHHLGLEVPADLYESNITTEVAGDDVLRPVAVADGDRTGGYFGRLGWVGLERPAGSMSRGTERRVRACEVAATDAALWAEAAFDGAARVSLEMTTLDGRAAAVDGAPGQPLELRWDAVQAVAGEVVRVRVVARDSVGRILETVPADGIGRRLAVPDAGGASVWTA
ncbi:MAG: glycoside hydrolase family 57 protein [Vicinamibacterales bacterium]